MPFDFACPDWFEKLEAGETPIAHFDFDDQQEKTAKKAVGIFNKLRLPDVPGQPTLAESAGQWVRDIVRAIFGSMETAPGAIAARQVAEVFILVPKKNAKTTNSAAIAITFMMMNTRPRADMLIVGPTQKISDVAFEQAKGMIEADEFLSKRLHVQDHKNTIVDRVNKSRLMVRTFAMDVLTGAKPIFCLIDEIHILGKIPYARDVIRQIRSGMLPFRESLLVMITTQSDHPPQGVFRSNLKYARGVRDGKITQHVRLLPVLYEFPEEIQTDKDQLWKNPEMWALVTPNLGLSVTIEGLVEGFHRAIEDGKDEIIGWATQHLNVEVGMALHADRWQGADQWEGAGDKRITLDLIIEECEVVTCGIDGGGLDDLTGFAVIGRHRKTKVWLAWCHAWAHNDVLEQRKEIADLLRDFEKFGDLTICDEPTQDVLEVADNCEMLFHEGLLPEKDAIGMDSHNVVSFHDELILRGIPDELMIGIPQGTRLLPMVNGLPRKLKDKTLVHGGQEMMAWVVGNALPEQRGNASMITKQVAGKAKIDPLIALFNAGMLMSRNPIASHSSIKIPDDYEVA